MAQSIPLPVRKDSLGEKLKNYSLLAGSILASSFVAQGQVVYTDLIPDVTLGGFIPASFPHDTSYALDLNNDGTFEFNIVLNFMENDPSALFYESVNGDWDAPNNLVLIYRTGQYHPWAAKVPCGVNIPLSTSFYNSHVAGLSYQVGGIAANRWKNIHNRAVGLEFKIDSLIHYGWVRLDVNTMDSIPVIVIKDYAYEETVLKQIAACDSVGVGIPNSNDMKNEVSIFPNPSDGKCVLKFEKPLKNEVEISVTDVFGKEVYGTNIRLKSQQEQFPLDFSHLASGIYFIQLKSEEFSLTQKWIKN